jgi:hypothetical protein
LPRSRRSAGDGPGLPDALTPATLAVCVWGGASAEWLAAVLPAAVAAVFAGGGYALWVRRDRPWHDPVAIVALLPALAASLWLAVGGTVLEDGRGGAGRLLLEVGPGLALTGLLCTMLGYHGKHHPDEGP